MHAEATFDLLAAKYLFAAMILIQEANVNA